MIDLHCHSTFSDGSLTPEELVDRACSISLAALALTDHDTMAGIPRFLAAAKGRPIVPIPGVELSVDLPNGGSMHMLGYGLDPENPALLRQMEWIRDGRTARNREILRKLNELGFPMTAEEVAAAAGEGVVGRPHFAQVMIQKGYAKNKDEVFDKWLGDDCPACANRPHLDASTAIRLVHDAGGIAVLAHPFTLHYGKAAMNATLDSLAAAGLDGIECHYTEHSPSQTRDYLEFAAARNLLVTGGSDFHGVASPGISLGTGFGSLRVPDDLLPPLLARLHR